MAKKNEVKQNSAVNNVGVDKQPKDIRWVFCKQYVNRWGKLMIASDYGYQFWRFPSKGA